MKYLAVLFFAALIQLHTQAQTPVFRNEKLSVEARVNNLLEQLSLEEKISLLGFASKSIDRLGIPAYNWWNEALHGVARAGQATVFPQAIAMAASFDDNLMEEVAAAISTEARAKYNLSSAKTKGQQYMGLTFWSPNINIFRDPRWGRGQETYGEDPYLTSKIGMAFVNGLQGNNPNILKTSACAKHYAVHSGPEALRHEFNAIVDEKDLRETYLYAFKKLVDGGVESVMCAYNRVNGEPCCTSPTLLQNILKNEWQFKGHIVTDCWALSDIWERHKVMPNSVVVAAEAIKHGVNLDCSNLLQDDVMNAIAQNLLSEKDVNNALSGILRTQIKLGFYNNKANDPFKDYLEDSIANDYHCTLSKKMSGEAMVLLKNKNNILPLNKTQYNSYMIVGPNAASLDALLGNYHGVSSKAVNFVEGIANAVGKGSAVSYDMGCSFFDTTKFGGIWAAGNADITIAVIGLSPVYEGEEGDAFLSTHGGDKKDLQLPPAHITYLRKLKTSTKKPVITVITGGSALDVSSIEPYSDAIIFAWYPGEQGGNALADIIFGKINPSGRLPLTFYKTDKDIPPYDSYAMQGRTYRYYSGDVLYPFGYGLSYTQFTYAWLQAPQKIYSNNNSISFSVQVHNTGNFNGNEVVQAYIQYPSIERMPIKELKSFRKIYVEKNKTAIVSFEIPITELLKWDIKKHDWVLYKGAYNLFVGSHSKDKKLEFGFTVH
ncbi:MAG: glycoside hydrolase family 3 C-terminal domain-containing protein [Niabella sp.]